MPDRKKLCQMKIIMPDQSFFMPDALKLCQIWHTLCKVETTGDVFSSFLSVRCVRAVDKSQELCPFLPQFLTLVKDPFLTRQKITSDNMEGNE